MSRDHEKTMALFNQSGQSIINPKPECFGHFGKDSLNKTTIQDDLGGLVVIICPATPSAKAHMQKTNWLAMFLEVFCWWGRHFRARKVGLKFRSSVAKASWLLPGNPGKSTRNYPVCRSLYIYI